MSGAFLTQRKLSRLAALTLLGATASNGVLEAGADLFEGQGLFDDVGGDALAGQRKRRRQAGNAGADDGRGSDGGHGNAGLSAVTPQPGW